jgi:NAD(P)-dependent dehydrogenase (short-subunit alcohol dehydrogenase family)
VTGRLDGRVAVVTGAGRGIGAAIAAALVAEGAAVVLGGRDRERLAAQAARLSAQGTATACAGDLTTPAGRDALIEAAGRVDILVNNAGGFVEAVTTADASREDWDRQIELNLTVPFLMCQAVLDGMVRRGWGRILNIGSVVATAPQAGNAIGYVAAKAGLVGFTRQLAVEVAGTGVTANVLNPGTVRTEHLLDYFAASGVAERDLAANIPVGRLGAPEEIASLVPALVGEGGGFLTGAVIDVNGGAVHA